ncbi:MAG: methyltransferase domain-containing protein [Gemmataceae bacterium]
MFGWFSKKPAAVEPAAAPRPPGEFQGSPWNAEPTEDWNRPPFWQNYYRDLLAEKDTWRRESVVHRGVDLLIRMLADAGELPRSSPQTLLDAGCGIALIPHILARWGFRVTAIDSCPSAIEVASRHLPSEQELARCVPIWEPCRDYPGARELVTDLARSLRRLREFHAPGGSVTYSVGDWSTADLPAGSFGVVHCRNSLRCSTKPYWRRSLRQFHELLSPGGLLLLETVNAIGVQDEVDELLAECGFVPYTSGTNREASYKYFRGMWPTG